VLRRPLDVLQLNLCNSGMAPCWTQGRAVTRAADLVREQRPDVVTLNEVCRDDVDAVRRAMRGLPQDGVVVSAFRPTGDRPSGGPVQCTDGQDFGVGIVVRIAAPYRGHQVASGIYTAQDPADPEIRVWACVVATGQFRACVTHLAAIGGGIALAQCRQLMADGLGGGALPVLVGGDFNLGPRGRADIRSCVPPGMARVDDGGVQNVVVDSADFAVTGRRAADVRRTTDHPGLLVGTTFTRRIRATRDASES
jgi:endonuclease/exonuclease/phosphatase family metal-dependent hydrolase